MQLAGRLRDMEVMCSGPPIPDVSGVVDAVRWLRCKSTSTELQRGPIYSFGRFGLSHPN